jgi:PAS domain S-box-containing protein
MLNFTLNILLVDDDPDDYLLTKETLHDIDGLKFTLEWQSSFDAGLVAVQDKAYDLYLFDYHIGAKSGYDLLVAAKAAGVRAPIIMLTGNGDFEADRKAIQAGAADYLVKGTINMALLEKSIRHALERNKMMLELENKTEEAEKLALVASRTENAVIITDAAGYVEWVNDGFVRLTGYSLEDVKGAKPGHFLQGEGTDAATMAMVSQAIKNGEAFTCELLNYTKDKKPYWVRIDAQPIYDDAGALEQFIAIETDITESKRAQELLREAEAQQRATLRAIPDYMFVMDRQGNYLRAEAPSQATLPLSLVGKNLSDVTYLPQAMIEQTRAVIENALSSGQMQSYEYIIPDVSGKPQFFEGRVVPLDSERVLILSRDISERKQSELALRESEERYSLAAQGANDGLWDWDISANKVYFSPRWKEMLGYAPDDVGDTLKEWSGRLHPEDAERVQEEIDAHLEGKTSNFESEHRLRHKDGSYRWVLSRAVAVRGGDGSDGTGKATRMTGWMTDSSSRVATYDALTNLPNRKLFTDRVQRAITRTKQEVFYQFAVLYIDLDGFKFVNDTLGHAAGDALLTQTSLRLEHSLRQSDTVARFDAEAQVAERLRDTVARFGGDEFAILLDGFRDIHDVVAIAERIQKGISEPYILESQSVFSTASIGIALSSDRYTTADDMLRDADIAMYRAKHEGKARHALFDSKMHAQVKARFSLETELRRALDRREFRVYYQPIVRLKTAQVVGFEALVRWQHATRGMISPAEFIPLAEETGLIVQLDMYVLREALLQLKRWHSLNPALTMSVNLSSRQFDGNNLVVNVREALQESGVNPASLALEVTEGMLARKDERIYKMLSTLRSWGTRIYIDDFGTGYSSLSRLNELPIDLLKVDKSFIDGLEALDEKAKMSEAIIVLARALGLEIVAEGIETEDQKGFLNELHCTYGQGYFFSKPLSAETMTEWLGRSQDAQLVGKR